MIWFLACTTIDAETGSLCGDGFDNDGDGVADCSDADCEGEAICAERDDTGFPGDDSDADVDTDMDTDTDAEPPQDSGHDTGRADTGDPDEVDVSAFFPLDDGQWTYAKDDRQLTLRVDRTDEWVTIELVEDDRVVTGVLGRHEGYVVRVEAVLGDEDSFDVSGSHGFVWTEQSPNSGTSYGTQEDGQLTTVIEAPYDCDQGECLVFEARALGDLAAIDSDWVLVRGDGPAELTFGSVEGPWLRY